MAKTVNENWDIDFGKIEDYPDAKSLSIKVREFDLYFYRSLHDTYLLVNGELVIGEFAFAKDHQYDNALYEHTAHLDATYRGKGIYADVLHAVRDYTGLDIISYPFDPDSEQERSQMNNRFWAKHGILINQEDGLTYKFNK